MLRISCLPVARFASDFAAYILLDTRVVHVNKNEMNQVELRQGAGAGHGHGYGYGYGFGHSVDSYPRVLTTKKCGSTES